MSLVMLTVGVAGCSVVAVLLGVALAFRREDRFREELEEARALGLDQPSSLHPVVHLETCIGSGGCVDACPERVLGQVAGVTHLLQGGACVGHGRCQAACPVDAIALVFGTSQRGVDLPLLRAGYETHKGGVFVVGELGGMGLIRNAMRQGLAVVPGVRTALGREEVCPPEPGAVDVLIVGAGPAGIAAALGCTQAGLSFRVLEQHTVGGSVSHYPRRKVVLTEPIRLPGLGKVGRREMRKEEVVAVFQRILAAGGIEPLEDRRVAGVEGAAGAFRVLAARSDGSTEVHSARTVVLAVGRRGTPRTLGVPGEDLPHVVYRLLDPEQYRRRRVLVVGGGDSAVESAVAVGGVAGARAHLSYRGASFHRVKRKNRLALEEAVAAERVVLHLETEVREVTDSAVVLEGAGGRRETLEADDVVVQIGGVLPTAFLRSIGVEVETKRGEVAVAPLHGPFAGGGCAAGEVSG